MSKKPKVEKLQKYANELNKLTSEIGDFSNIDEEQLDLLLNEKNNSFYKDVEHIVVSKIPRIQDTSTSSILKLHKQHLLSIERYINSARIDPKNVAHLLCDVYRDIEQIVSELQQHQEKH